ncbi:MAG TPA: NUDIX domain-containing protein [Clostridiaceae bacterium]|jgi:mutator mutT protein|nr:NUDIX domain-containing protein [Clostridium sp.]CDE54746.1 mutator MutT protein [Clostridium sp. CAG:269]HJJ09499.1 NUDIX domain-containing protein [Clostridiaceae bacterium]
MDKPIRKAVRCYLIKDNEVVVTKYKKGNKKEGYYDIPGGKIEEGESPKQTAIREMKEETGIEIQNLKYKGIMTIEYPDRLFIFDTFITKEYEGEPQEFEENTSEWIDIDELLKKEKILSNIILLDKFLIKGLIDDNRNFNLHIKVDEQENILGIDYNLEKIINKK